ncbi:MAG: flagellar motor switch protein FliG [Treponema sp.]|jgi:flagellar motor switch protein FliG|nr:flagellar motor switch protein FliG [Treponema sp.]
MAKIKTPVWPELPPEDPAPRAPLNQGIAAYRNAMQPPPTDRAGKTAPAREQNAPAEGFLKTGKGQETPAAGDGGDRFRKLPRVLPQENAGGEPAAAREGGDSKLRRVAKFLILIGGDEAAGILSKLDIEQVEAISREIASIRGISGEEASVIFEEFRSLLSANYGFMGANSGGVEAARRLLYAAFGPEKGMEFLNRALPNTKENPLSFLEELSGEQIALLLREESPAAAAMILARLSPKLSAETLVTMGSDRKTEIVRRIARLGQTAPEALEQAAAALREKARKLGAVNPRDEIAVDGRGALAAILKQSDFSFGDRIIQELDQEDPDLSQELKERLNTLEDVIKAENRPLQEKLRSMNDRDLALLLKGKTPEFTDKILSNLSAQRRTVIREEMSIMGAVPRRDVDEATKSFLAWFRESREGGRILLIDDEDVIV